MFNLAINLFLFIAILFMLGFMVLFIWIVTVIAFAIKEVMKAEDDKDGKPNSKEH